MPTLDVPKSPDYSRFKHLPIVIACEAVWPEHSSNCSGFFKAVAQRLGINVFDGMAADSIATHLGSSYCRVLSDGNAAREKHLEELKTLGITDDAAISAKALEFAKSRFREITSYLDGRFFVFAAATAEMVQACSGRATHHGHVAILVPGATHPVHGAPQAYWGQLGKVGARYEVLSQSFSRKVLPFVTLASIQIPATVLAETVQPS